MSGGLIVEVVPKAPIKTYKIIIRSAQAVGALCEFLRNNQDKRLKIIVNGREVVFKTFSGKKRFAAGIKYSAELVEPFTKRLFEDLQSRLTSSQREIDLLNGKVEAQQAICAKQAQRINVLNTVSKLRKEAYEDHVNDLTDCLEVLRDELEEK